MNQDAIREQIRALVAQYAALADTPKMFIAGETPVPPSGKVVGTEERQLMVDAALDAWLTTGRFNQQFQQRLSEFLGVRHVLTTVSGSAANLLALTTLTSPQLGDKRLLPGDEVITVAAGFPTTVNPIVQNGLIPVFVDVDLDTLNIDATLVRQAISPKTKAIMIAHTLGNPFDLATIRAIADEHDLWLIEDCCDALGSRYNGQLVGTFGDIATLSFYPAHHITMGEGGAVFMRSLRLKKIAESFRDWGRDCYCDPGKDNTCGKRFEQQFGSLPDGYDHKYTYSHMGYNLKITDMQAACALAQMDRLEYFIAQRKENFHYLTQGLSNLTEYLQLPQATPNSDPSWFGYPITLRSECGVSRAELIQFLDQAKIGTRLLFAGNLTRQPYFKDVNYRVASSLEMTDKVMNQTFWVGVYPGLSKDHLDFTIQRFQQFFAQRLK
jgi:CDP-6-deoxy-D-xylo-4-hexulose-3-dehydrase